MTADPAGGLIGLVLAGGRSRRMGEDKGALVPHGIPQAERCRRLLAPHCVSVYVSVRPDQAGLEPYRDQPLILDDPAIEGPAAGLLAAWARFPDRALLVLAVDLVLIDAGTLDELVRRRNTQKAATAFRHADGVIEPLCTIFEPGIAKALRQRAAAGDAPSLRRLLEDNDVEALVPPDAGKLSSCNTPEAFAAARAALERR